MIGIYISVATLAITILGATWRLSSMLSALTEAFHGLQKALDELRAVVNSDTKDIVRLNGRMDRVEQDVERINDKLDAA